MRHVLQLPLVVLAFPFLLGAADPREPAPEPAPFVVANREVFVFRATIANATPAERAENAGERLRALSFRSMAEPVVVQPVGNGRLIGVGKTPIFGVLPDDIDPLGNLDLDATAAQAAQRLEQALSARAESLRPGVILRGLAQAFGGTVVAAILAAGLLWVRRRVLGLFLRRTEAKREKLMLFGIDLRERAAKLIEWAVRLALFVGLLFVAYLWLTYVFGRFPFTQPWADALGTFLFGLFANLGTAFVRAVPGLIAVAVIFLLARFAVHLAGEFFDAVDAGRVNVPGVFAETVGATRRLVTAVLWVAAVVVAYPYVPGSDGAAFKGVSVLVGVMVTLGGAGIVNQMMSGLVLVYSRALKKGDLVEVSGNTGVVTEVGPLSTKVRTRYREELTIPNALLTSSIVRNYTRLTGAEGAMIATKITIGYDAPWRQVHALLKLAAERADDVLADPPPIVLQSALSDFYVEYELRAYVASPERRIEALSNLHAAIQDAFNEFGVQIMSPNFEDQPAEKVWVPKARWHEAPAPPPAGKPGA